MHMCHTCIRQAGGGNTHGGHQCRPSPLAPQEQMRWRASPHRISSLAPSWQAGRFNINIQKVKIPTATCFRLHMIRFGHRNQPREGCTIEQHSRAQPKTSYATSLCYRQFVFSGLRTVLLAWWEKLTAESRLFERQWRCPRDCTQRRTAGRTSLCAWHR